MHAFDILRVAPRWIDTGEGEVAYRRVGTGPDVLFVHGWPVSGATFRRVIPFLAERVTCHVIDLVGAGSSRFDRSHTIDLASHIRGLRRVVDALELRAFSLFGHDSGGLMARHAFAGDPRVRSLALVNTEQPRGLHWRFKQFLWMAKLPGFASILAFLAMRPRLRRSPLVLGGCFADPSLLDGEFESLFLAPLGTDRERRWAAGQLARRFDTSLVDGLAEVHAKIDVPVQLIWGRDDPFFPLAWAEEMVGTFPDARLHVVQGARLFVHEEKAQEVAQAALPVLLAD